MKKQNLFSLLILPLFLISCKLPEQTVLVAGDSWAFLTCKHKSLERSLQKLGLKNTHVNATCLITSDPGARASDWLQTNFHRNVMLALKEPTVKVLYLSLGGNDVINGWHKTMTAAETEEFLSRLRKSVEEILAVYRSERPDIQILVTGYDYPRFTPHHPVSAYRKAYEDMGSPTPLELNRVLLRMTENFMALGQTAQTAYIHHLGLMQYYSGLPQVGIPPHNTKPPTEISKPGVTLNSHGGVVSEMSEATSMQVYSDNDVVNAVDAFHLSKEGYDRLADHSVLHYLRAWLTEVAEGGG